MSIDWRQPEFEESNLFFWAVLGAISLSSKLDVVLPARSDRLRFPSSLDEPTLALLGVIAVKSRLMSILDGEVAEFGLDGNTVPKPQGPAGGLLR